MFLRDVFVGSKIKILRDLSVDYFDAIGIVALHRSDIGFSYILLDKENTYATAISSFFEDTQAMLIEKYGSDIETSEKRLLCLNSCLSSDNNHFELLIENNDFDDVPGVFTCECGFSNQYIARSAFINGKYVCRSCRFFKSNTPTDRV